MLSRRLLLPIAGFLSLAVPFASAQNERHGRKYKAPPETSHLEVLVLKDTNGKVIENAAVIFHPSKDGNDEGNLEVKSGTDGKAFIDIIPTGSDVQIQVIANGFTTHAETIKLDAPSRQVTIRMKRPQHQVSAYDDDGKGAQRTVGVQEPVRRTAPTEAPKPLPASEPIIKLPSLPSSNTKKNGDATVPAAHTDKPADSDTVKPPTSSSSPKTPVVDGNGGSSPSN